MADVDINKFRASVVRDGSKPASPGFVVSEGQSPTDPAGSGQNHLPVTITPIATGLSITEDQVLGGAGLVSQYIRGDGSLADFPSSSGGGSSVSYYLNGSVAQGTIGGIAYKELNKVPILGAGTDFTINANGYIASFITDSGDPNLLEIPGGNWNFETYFSASSSGGSPSFYVELYKVNSGGTATLIASNSGFPELIAFGTNIISYFSTLAVPTTTLALTDRLAIRYYVTHSGRTITLHTEDNHLCQIITTFTTGLTSLNGLTVQVQNLAVGTSGTDFNIASAIATHTFNLPTASATNRGALSSADWTIFNNKQNALTNPVTGTGTTNVIPKFTGASTIGDSAITDNTNEVNISKRLFVNSGGNSFTITPNLGSVSNRIESSALPLEMITSGSAIRLAAGGVTPQITLASTGVVTLSNLAGTGSRIVTADASGNLSASSALSGYIQGTGTTNTLPKFTGTTTIGNSNLINDASGNLGLGVTPNAWATTSKAIQFGTTGILENNNGGSTYFGYNAFRSSGGGWIYLTNSFANIFGAEANGDFAWYNASSGTAGNSISFAERFRITQGGDANFNGRIKIENSSTPSGGNSMSIGGASSGGYAYLQSWNSQPITLNPLGNNVLVGTTTDNGARLQVSGTATVSSSLTASGLITGQSSIYQSNASGSIASNRWETFNGGATQMFFSFPASGSVAFNNGSDRFTISNTGAATFSSSITSTLSSGIFLNNSSGGTNATQIRINNTSGDLRLGIESSTGGTIQLGTLAYAAVFGNQANNAVQFTTNGTARMTITSSGNVGIGTASPVSIGGYTALTLNNATTGGILTFQRNGANIGSIYNTTSDITLGVNSGNATFETSGAERMRITSGGNVLIGTTTDAAGVKLRVAGGIIGCLDVYNNTTGAAANMQIDANGFFARSTSSIKYKKNVKDYTKGLIEVMQLRPVLYEGKSESDKGKIYAGLIAEEVHNLGLTEFVQYATDGSPDALSYQNMISLLTKAIQELKQEIDTLKN